MKKKGDSREGRKEGGRIEELEEKISKIEKNVQTKKTKIVKKNE